MGDEHRHPRAVLARVEDLLDLVTLGVELDLGPADQAALAGGQVER